MVMVNKLKVTDTIAQYYYQPEREGEPGIVEINLETGVCEYLKIAEGDNIHTRFYRRPTQTLLEIFREKQSFPEEYVYVFY